ncbi:MULTISPECIES: hypothetical protein [Pseudoalteromonas]|uniref:hypothetical protein n=1 Tax=Pseudoalteromonas TaxID=53246 RepID=UPI00037FA42D|nr:MULTISPECIES: hypothetical protein [Pseudoalteromonas]MCF6146641.1 hypothetical protein [Pseudoalteromonas mariniglutinosa NCIMB 1770]TMN71033.1 hypothetical protein CWB85_13040 [Pseudoalteromonas sp. S1727]
MNMKRTFSATKRRHLMACLLALITAVVMIPGMTTYLPFAMEEQILIPIMLFPFIWAGLFIYAYMAEKAWQPFVVMLLIILSHAGLSFMALSGAQG